MKKYRVKAGATVHENGMFYKEGDEFVTTPTRAVELGLGEKLEEVEELEIIESQNEGISKLIADLEAASATIADLKSEIVSKDADLEAASATIAELNEKLKSKKK